ncbi:hypothetical protein EIP91_007853 [Steccherinum ochraceum]|uniref:RTA1-domain-containing protein n=1 Tax=Steccherinum ochraceum TaxID=92696 RepID=A0A4R0RHM9_9APHY|nr:hypothetical protein EIP91_007853 [Steccherinum ochraceum]
MSNGTDNQFPPDTFGPDGSVVKSPYYKYLVDENASAAFVALYGASTLIHFIQASYFRQWFLLPTVVLAGIGETLGWSGRLWSVFAPLKKTPYLLQIVVTILAPTPFVAALFMIFARVTEKLGDQYSRLSPRWYARIFLAADLIALIVQGVGGGLAASADTDSGSNLGGNIMLGGIVFQLVALVIFIILASEFYIRYIYDRPCRQTVKIKRVPWGTEMRVFTGSMALVLGLVLIRTLELSDGWNGTIIVTQIYFDVFDGMMILLAMVTVNAFHPGWWMIIPAEHEGYSLPSQMTEGNLESNLTRASDSTVATLFTTPKV